MGVRWGRSGRGGLGALVGEALLIINFGDGGVVRGEGRVPQDQQADEVLIPEQGAGAGPVHLRSTAR